jgi:hypothetical protein
MNEKWLSSTSHGSPFKKKPPKPIPGGHRTIPNPPGDWPPTPGSIPPDQLNYLAMIVTAKEAAAGMTDERLRSELLERADQAIASFIDDYCGSLLPWPWPGPPPWITEFVAELVATANAFEPGVLRSELLRVASEITERSLRAYTTGVTTRSNEA